MNSEKLEKIAEAKSHRQRARKFLFDLQKIVKEFNDYWKVLLSLTIFYFIVYFVWSGFKFLSKIEENRGWLVKKDWFVQTLFVVAAMLFRGGFFSLDGIITAWLKTPFGQVCYAINKFEEISEEEKKIIIFKITESNEHCKETFKKFGILTISLEILTIVNLSFAVDGGKGKVSGKGELLELILQLMIFSYFVPLILAVVDIIQIRNIFKKIKHRLELKLLQKRN